MGLTRRLLLSAVLWPTALNAQSSGNDTILTLAKAGLGDGVIVDKVNSSPCTYDVSTDGLIALKRAQISDSIISAIVRRCATLGDRRGTAGDDTSADPKVRHSPGIYLFQTWQGQDRLAILHPSKSSGLQTSGNGSILFPLIVKMVIPGIESSVKIQVSNPSFYFYFNTSDTKVSDFGTENSAAAQSPSEFSLVRLKQQKTSRELAVSKASGYGGAAMRIRAGVDPRAAVIFDSEEVGGGIYRVSVAGGLPNGQYAYVFTGANGTARIYDFSIEAPATVGSVQPAK